MVLDVLYIMSEWVWLRVTDNTYSAKIFSVYNEIQTRMKFVAQSIYSNASLWYTHRLRQNLSCHRKYPILRRIQSQWILGAEIFLKLQSELFSFIYNDNPIPKVNLIQTLSINFNLRPLNILYLENSVGNVNKFVNCPKFQSFNLYIHMWIRIASNL